MTYSGLFEKGQMHGQGKQVWADGRVYEGDFLNGMKHGEGTMLEENNKMYAGQWDKNLKHGIGYESNIAGGTRRKGEWKHGQLFRWLSKTETQTNMRKK
jgi:hypothetical protein